MATVKATWRPIVDSNTICRSSQVVFVAGDHLNIFGGEIKPRQPVDNKLYHVSFNDVASSNVVQTKEPSSAPTPRVGSASTNLNGKTYLFSGRGGEAMAPIEENGALHVLDPSRGQWSVLTPADASAPIPPARSYHALASDGVSKIYLHAGCPEKGRLSDLWVFDVDARAWSRLASAPDPPRGGTSIAHLDGRLYRMNGFDGKNEQGFALDIYDTTAGVWSTHRWDPDAGPPPRSVSALLPLRMSGRDVLLTMFGESDPSNLGHQGAGRMLDDVWAYDVAAEKWIQIEVDGQRPQARGWFAAGVVPGMEGRNVAVVHGGLAEDNTRLGDVWMLNL